MTFLAFSLTASAQFTFPTVVGPTNVVAGAPVTLNINDAANAAGATAGSYSSFIVTADWVAGGGFPWSSDAGLTVTTAAGAVVIASATTGATGNGVATTMTFEGNFTALYDPSVNGSLDIALNQSFSGSDADWSNIVVQISPPLTCGDPTGLLATPAETSADFSWTAPVIGTPTGYNWEIQPNGIAQGTAGALASGNVAGTTVNSGVVLTAFTSYEFYVQTDCGVDGTSIYATFGFSTSNDECTTAIALTVNTDFACGTTTSATIAGATASGIDETACGGTEDDDVWFSFVATATAHRVDLINVAGSTMDLNHSLWEGANCGSLTLVAGSCSDPNTSNPSGLTIGNTYYLRVYSWTATAGQNSTFDVCIGTPPPPPANDDCVNATPYTNDFTMFAAGACVGTPNMLDLGGATDDIGNDDPSCDASPNAGVWYTWTATSTGLIFTSGAGLPGLAVYDAGTCGSLVQVGCINNESGIISGLTIGNNYIFFIWDDDVGTAVDFCLEEFTPPTDNCGAYSSSPGSTVTEAAPVNDVITVTGTVGDVITDLNVIIAIDHTFLGDLDITLTSPTGTVVGIMFGQCGTNENMNIEFDDEGVAIVCGAPTVGTFNTVGTGSGALSGFDTEALEGDWTLNVVDTSIGDVGTLIQWCLVPTLTTLSIGDSEFSGFKYYPNPVTNKLTLSAQNTIQNVTVYNMLGQQVLRTAPNAIENDIDMSSLQTGTYFVQVTINNVTETVRIIKQ